MDRQRKAQRVLKRAFMAVSTMCVLLMVFSWRLITSDEIHAGQRISRVLLERGPEQQEQQKRQEEKVMRLRMIHRNAHDSPFREQWETRLESLKSLVRHDRTRLEAFSSFMENTIPSSVAEAPDYSPVEERPRSGYGMARTPIFSGAFVGSGQYFIDLEIGTPPKRVLLIADTGSDLFWVNCRRHGHNLGARAFDVHASSTFSPIPCTAEECQLVPAPPQATCSLRHPTSCDYMYMYSDQSDSVGIFAYETVTINATGANPGGTRIPNVAFGCSDATHGRSFVGADGVIGLGQGPISFTSQLGYMYDDKFSYCLVNHLKANDEPSGSSNYLVFGDPNLHYLKLPRLQHTPILKIPIAVLETYYYLDVRGVNVNGKRLSIPRSAWEVDSTGKGGTIIDSGTTLSYVLNPAYRLILATFERLVTHPRIKMDPFDLCFNSSGIADPRLPDFSIDFEGGARFHPAVDNYFLDATDGVKCLGILESSSPFGFNVIGNVMQQNFFFEFDRRKSRLGFARTDCSRH